MVDLQASLQASPALTVDIPEGGCVQYRRAGLARHVTHVLLHGIGSGSASWVAQLHAARHAHDVCVLAWEAPGYGGSSPLESSTPVAEDYAARMWSWLDALQQQGMDVSEPFALVGHSLGALIATRAAAMRPQSVSRLFLLSPAKGYGDASAQEREEKLRSRLHNLKALGPADMAKQRAHAMLSPKATQEQLEWVRDIMSQIQPHGYTQATHMLSQGLLLRDLASIRSEVFVASGEADGITPAAACDLVAHAAGGERISLGPVGHACPLEAAERVSALIGLGRAALKEGST